MKTCFCSVLLLFLPFVVAAQTISLSENDKTQIIAEIFKDCDFSFSNKNTASNKSKISINLSAENISPKIISGIEKVNVSLVSEKDIDEMVTTGGSYYYLGEFEPQENSSVKIIFGRIGIGKATGRGAGISCKYYCRKVSGKWTVKKTCGAPFHMFY